MSTSSNARPAPFTVFGATGKIGRELIRFFNKAEIPVRAVSRDISKREPLPYVTWVQADLKDAESLIKALNGAKGLFFAASFSNDLLELESGVINAAKSAGVVHAVKISTKSASHQSEFPISRLHAQAEDAWKQSGLQWTVLQPSGFMQNWLGDLSATVQRERKIYTATGDGKLAFIDTRDIAEVALAALTGNGEHRNKTYVLTGSDAVNYDTISDAIGQAIGEPVCYIRETPEQARIRMQHSGVPEWGIQLFLTMAEFQRLGKSVEVSSAVRDILGKPPRTVYEFAKDYAERFK